MHPQRATALRIGFGALWIGAQAALVLTASRRSEAAFGFQMFSESSTISVHLSRSIDAPGARRRPGTAPSTVIVGVPSDGAWITHGPAGDVRVVRWSELVRQPELAAFDTSMHASYSAGAQVARWKAAADYVASHIPDDAETRAIVLDITTQRNGHEPVTVRYVAERYLYNPRNG